MVGYTFYGIPASFTAIKTKKINIFHLIDEKLKKIESIN